MRFVILSVVLLSACAQGGEGPVDRSDSGNSMMDGGGGGDCVPACRPPGEMCVAGRCVAAGNDVDMDGVPVEADCDDNNPEIGSSSSRACVGVCGGGMETCSDGIWGACDAPTECACVAGDPSRTIGCGGFCGMQHQECIAGAWVSMGGCEAEGVCAAGSMEMDSCTGGGTKTRLCAADCRWSEWDCRGGSTECEVGQIDRDQQSCGTCGGMQERSRTCVDRVWGTWSAWGTCAGDSGECTPGQMGTDSGACPGGCGGTRSRTRVCASSCRWEAWGTWGSCSGGGGSCTPGQTRGCSNGDSCGVERCSSSCEWGATCEPREAGGCLRIRPGTGGPAGNNFRCCTPGGGGSGWQFCLSSCQWSVMCEAHSC